jgi:SsrA-binding protein
MPVLANNKKARFDYQILEKFQAGLVLSGKMVKQIRSRRINLNGRFVISQNDQLQIIGLGNEYINENVTLLLKKSEKNNIQGNLTEKGITCVVLDIHVTKRWLKADIALVKGKKTHDKRQSIKERDISREMQRELL